jgi:hypothetical protein
MSECMVGRPCFLVSTRATDRVRCKSRVCSDAEGVLSGINSLWEALQEPIYGNVVGAKHLEEHRDTRRLCQTPRLRKMMDDDHVVPTARIATHLEMLRICLTCQINVMRECTSLLKQGKLLGLSRIVIMAGSTI